MYQTDISAVSTDIGVITSGSSGPNTLCVDHFRAESIGDLFVTLEDAGWQRLPIRVDGLFVVQNDALGIYGAGKTLNEAAEDFKRSLRDTIKILSDGTPLSAYLAAKLPQLEAALKELEVT